MGWLLQNLIYNILLNTFILRPILPLHLSEISGLQSKCQHFSSIHLVRPEEYRLRVGSHQWIGAFGFNFFFFSRLIAHSNRRISAFNWCLTTSNCGYCNYGNALVSLGYESLTWELDLCPFFVQSHLFPGRAFTVSPGLREVLEWLRSVQSDIWGDNSLFGEKALHRWRLETRGEQCTREALTMCFVVVV